MVALHVGHRAVELFGRVPVRLADLPHQGLDDFVFPGNDAEDEIFHVADALLHRHRRPGAVPVVIGLDRGRQRLQGFRLPLEGIAPHHLWGQPRRRF